MFHWICFLMSVLIDDQDNAVSFVWSSCWMSEPMHFMTRSCLPNYNKGRFISRWLTAPLQWGQLVCTRKCCDNLWAGRGVRFSTCTGYTLCLCVSASVLSYFVLSPTRLKTGTVHRGTINGDRNALWQREVVKNIDYQRGGWRERRGIMTILTCMWDNKINKITLPVRLMSWKSHFKSSSII